MRRADGVRGAFVGALGILVWAVLLVGLGAGEARAQTGQVGQKSGFPLPRFASVKSQPVNFRVGPSRDHEVAWTFLRAGLPVEITQEFDIWFRVRDSEGQEGWVQQSFLSGKRTALVSPWAKAEPVPMYARADGQSLVARVEPNVLVDIERCDGRMCRVSVEKRSGWIEQSRLWGVYPNEKYPAD
ncbi:SH3 domain-containing protein [Prosthecomicrobium sp. N25]